jgi:hypothetical protein
LHTEAEGTTKISDKNKLHKVVHCTVDPTTSLGKKDAEGLRNSSFADSLGNEDLFPLRERAEHESREITILSKKQEILLV